MGQILDRTNLSYGHWKVIKKDPIKTKETGRQYWICECDCGCGTTKSLRGDSLHSVKVGGCDNMTMLQSKTCLKCEKKFYPKKQAKQRKYCYDCVPEEMYNGKGNTIRKLAKQWALDYKGNKCEICGYNKCNEALDFHHLDSTKKEFSLSDRNLSLDWPQIKNEIDKCILICANCHREIHAQENNKEGD